jgi:predicted nucleotidyltransferase
MAQVDEIVTLVRQVLGDDVIGAYLHGSAVLGELRPRSDTDVLVVSKRRTTPGERRMLVDRLLAISGGGTRSGAARPVELTIVVQTDVRPWRYPPRSEFQYGEWLRDDLEHGGLPAASTPSPDLAPTHHDGAAREPTALRAIAGRGPRSRPARGPDPSRGRRCPGPSRGS